MKEESADYFLSRFVIRFGKTFLLMLRYYFTNDSIENNTMMYQKTFLCQSICYLIEILRYEFNLQLLTILVTFNSKNTISNL